MYATPSRPMTQDELDLVCQVWADKGSDDSTGQWMELWDGGDSGEDPERRDAIVALADELGLQHEVVKGVLRVQHTQQTYDECGQY